MALRVRWRGLTNAFNELASDARCALSIRQNTNGFTDTERAFFFVNLLRNHDFTASGQQNTDFLTLQRIDFFINGVTDNSTDHHPHNGCCR